MKNKKGFARGALFGALAMLIIMMAVSCGRSLLPEKEAKEDTKKEAGTSEVGTKLELLEAYVEGYYLHDVDSEAQQEGIYRGFIEGLGDPYSVYYDKEETKALLETTAGEYSGVGAVLSQEKDTGIITIIQVYEESPAERAGIRDGDILYKVEGKEVTGQDLTEVVSHIKGEEGTDVDMVLLRGELKEEISLTATRARVQAQTVESEMKDGNIGYIRVTEYDTVTYEQYKQAMEELDAKGMEGLIVDLRSNPGGNLDTVCEMLDLMLPEGLVVYTEDKDGQKQEFTSDEEHQFNKPVVVMMNEFSASASEIFAGAMQDYGRGKIVGTQSYGKGVVQQLIDLEDGTCVKLTISEYFTPKGRNIDGEGITPDIEVEYAYDENNPDADNQLEKALEVIKE